MIVSSPTSAPIWLATRATDRRQSLDSRAELGRPQRGGDPRSGQVFVSRNKRADRVNRRSGEEDGVVIRYQRLEAGTFRFPAAESAGVESRAADRQMLLDGVDLESVRRPRR